VVLNIDPEGEISMEKRSHKTLMITLTLLFSHILAEQALSQPKQQNTISQNSAVSQVGSGDVSREMAKKIEMLEYKLETETNNLEKKYDDLSKSATLFMSILSIFVALLTVFSIYKGLQQHKDYISERSYIRERDRPFEEKQLENIEKLNSVISLVEKTFDLQHKREEEQSNLVKDLFKVKEIVDQLETESKERYSDAKELILSLETVKAMEWPGLLEEIQHVSDKARNKFEEVSRTVLKNEEDQHPYEIAKLYQLIGISALYSNDIDSSFKHLKEADRIYENNALRPDDTMSRAYTKHFLGVGAKNWRKAGDVERGNIKEAHEYLLKAAEIVKDDPKQFLIPVTLTEVISYQSDQKQLATDKAKELIQRFKSLKENSVLDANQQTLFERTFLILGNIEVTEKRYDQAVSYYRKVLEINSRNVYAHLSILYANKSTDSDEWQKALSNLETTGLAKKRETVTKVIALVWAIIASHKANDQSREERYKRELESIGANLLHFTQRQPLFFSPISKEIKEFANLKSQLSQYLQADAY
jgi:tetratricopeptide (TPR) repeat protein